MDKILSYAGLTFSPSIFVDHFLSRLITICHICHNLRLLGQQRAAFIRMTCSGAPKQCTGCCIVIGVHCWCSWPCYSARASAPGHKMLFSCQGGRAACQCGSDLCDGTEAEIDSRKKMPIRRCRCRCRCRWPKTDKQGIEYRCRCRCRCRCRRGGGHTNILNDTIHRHPHSTAHIHSSFFALPNVGSLASIHPGTAAKINPRCGNRGYGQKWSWMIVCKGPDL